MEQPGTKSSWKHYCKVICFRQSKIWRHYRLIMKYFKQSYFEYGLLIWSSLQSIAPSHKLSRPFPELRFPDLVYTVQALSCSIPLRRFQVQICCAVDGCATCHFSRRQEKSRNKNSVEDLFYAGYIIYDANSYAWRKERRSFHCLSSKKITHMFSFLRSNSTHRCAIQSQIEQILGRLKN